MNAEKSTSGVLKVAEPSEEESSLPVVTHLRQEAQDFEALVAEGGSSCPDVALGMAAQRRAWADAIDQLRAELERKSDAIQKLWKERDEALAELAALKAAPVVGVEAMSDKQIEAEFWRQEFPAVDTSHRQTVLALWIQRGFFIKGYKAAREALRASLVAHKAANVSDNGTCDPSVSHNVRAAATMAQTKETP